MPMIDVERCRGPQMATNGYDNIADRQHRAAAGRPPAQQALSQDRPGAGGPQAPGPARALTQVLALRFVIVEHERVNREPGAPRGYSPHEGRAGDIRRHRPRGPWSLPGRPLSAGNSLTRQVNSLTGAGRENMNRPPREWRPAGAAHTGGRT